MKFRSTVMSLGVLFSTGAMAASPTLSAFTCKGDFGPEGRTWNIKASVITGSPILQGRGFVEMMRRPNFPSGIRIAPEGYYVIEHRLEGGGTYYKDAQNRFELRIPAAQPPMGATAGGFMAMLSLNGQPAGSIACSHQAFPPSEE